jgi:YVTN family beta-propeller protein
VQPYIVNTLILPTTYSDSSPYWVAISPASQVYITDSWNNSVDVYNSVTLNLVRIIPVGDYPRGITISPNGALAYAMNWGDGTVSVINTAAGSAVSLVVLDTSDPMFAAFSQDGTHAYVSCTNGNSKGKIDVVNVASNSVASDIAMLDGPINNSSAITPLARTLLPDPIFPAISGPIHYPLGIATSPRGGLVYAIDGGNSSIEVINTTSQSVTKWTKDAGIGTTGIILSPDGSQAYVEDGYTLLLQDFNTITSSYADTSATLGIQTEGIAMTPDGKYIYVVNEGGGGGSTVSVISTSNYTTVDTIALTGVETAQGIAITPNGQEAFVTNPEYEGYQGSVTVINTGTDN